MDNGWYIWEPYQDPENECSQLQLEQVVQVIEGMVWVTMSLDQWTVEEAREYGRFLERVK